MKPGENSHKNFGTNEIQMNIKYVLISYFQSQFNQSNPWIEKHILQEKKI